MFWQNSMRFLGGKAMGLKMGLLAGATVAMLAAAPAHAGVQIGFGFSIPIFTPVPTYVQPRPIYYAPPVNDYQPAYAPVPAPAVYPAPQPLYYSSPAYCPPPAAYPAPRPVFYHPIYRPRVVFRGQWGGWRQPHHEYHAWGHRGGWDRHRDFARRHDWH
jgi:hypothetical protein